MLKSNPDKTREWRRRSAATAMSKRKAAIARPSRALRSGTRVTSEMGFGRSVAAIPRKRQGISPKPMTPAKRADIKFSLMIREAAGWICARCRKDHSQNHAGLETSHFYNVRYYAVRYDPDNVIPLCGRFSNPNCHTGSDGWEYAKGDGQGYYNFMVMRLGAEGFFALGLKAQRHVKLREAVEAFAQTGIKR